MTIQALSDSQTWKISGTDLIVTAAASVRSAPASTAFHMAGNQSPQRHRLVAIHQRHEPCLRANETVWNLQRWRIRQTPDRHRSPFISRALEEGLQVVSQDLVEGLLLRCTTTVGGSLGMGVAGGHAAHGCKTGTRDDAGVSAALCNIRCSQWPPPVCPERHTQSLGRAAHPARGRSRARHTAIPRKACPVTAPVAGSMARRFSPVQA